MQPPMDADQTQEQKAGASILDLFLVPSAFICVYLRFRIAFDFRS